MRNVSILAAALLFATASAANATTIADPAGDYLATYTGPQNGDLDVLSATAAFDGTNFLLSSTLNGAVGTTTGSLFVWGINRGAGLPRLSFGTPSIGATIPFDAVIVLFPDGTLRVVTIPTAGAPTITNFAGAANVSGNTISGAAPLSLLFSTGFAPDDYTFAFWTRARVNPALDGTNAEVADFAPNSGFLLASSVPEPSTWLSMLLGFGVLGGALRFRRRRTKVIRQLA